MDEEHRAATGGAGVARRAVAAAFAAGRADRYCNGGVALRHLPPPRAQFGLGAAGVAYFLLRHATLRDDPAALQAAGRWSRLAVQALDSPAGLAADWAERDIPPQSLYYHAPGVWCVSALASAALGDTETVRRAVDRFVAATQDQHAGGWDATEGTLGRASLLLGASTLVEQLNDDLSKAKVRVAGEALASALGRVAVDARVGRDVSLLGAAHGWAGVAHALLRWSQATGRTAGAPVRDLLQRLSAARRPSGLWPRELAGDVVWPGWCHGSAGWVQLWTLAWEVIGSPELLALAEPVAAHAVRASDGDIPDHLCCGRAGQAYAALAMYQATEDERWLRAAEVICRRAVSGADAPGSREHSLMRGDVGIALLASELCARPAAAAMPLWRAPGPRSS